MLKIIEHKGDCFLIIIQVTAEYQFCYVTAHNTIATMQYFFLFNEQSYAYFKTGFDIAKSNTMFLNVVGINHLIAQNLHQLQVYCFKKSQRH